MRVWGIRGNSQGSSGSKSIKEWWADWVALDAVKITAIQMKSVSQNFRAGRLILTPDENLIHRARQPEIPSDCVCQVAPVLAHQSPDEKVDCHSCAGRGRRRGARGVAAAGFDRANPFCRRATNFCRQFFFRVHE